MIQKCSIKCFINSIQIHLYLILANGNLVQIQILTGRVLRTARLANDRKIPSENL